MSYIERSEEITGYRVRVVRRDAFRVMGYTLIVPPRSDKRTVSRFWDEVETDGRLAALSVGLHFDAYPPGFDEDRNPMMEFRITVVEPPSARGPLPGKRGCLTLSQPKGKAG